jgi:hypothetical protein
MHEWITLENLVLDEEFQQRNDFRNDRVETYAIKMMEDEWDWERSPITVVRTPEGDFVVDGFHRCTAAQKAEVEVVYCQVYIGDKNYARQMSYESNLMNGIAESRADTKKKMNTYVLDPMIPASRKKIKHLSVMFGVPEGTVKKWIAGWRPQMALLGSNDLAFERLREGDPSIFLDQLKKNLEWGGRDLCEEVMKVAQAISIMSDH